MIIKRLSLFWLLTMYLIVNATAGDWRQANYIVDSFFEIALKNEYSENGQTVRKWPANGIRYQYIHRVADNNLHEKLTELHLSHLQMITGLPIKPAKNIKDATLIIVFSQENSLKNDLQQFFDMRSAKERDDFFRHSICLGNFSTNADGAIRKAVIIIPVDRARGRAKLVDCIVEELTQVLGLPNDSEKVFPSIFNDRSIDHLLSGLDYTLLKILYDQRLRIGMNKAEAMPVVQSIVAGFIKSGLVKNADREVHGGGLYPLFYK
jgi:hypothetical protein